MSWDPRVAFYASAIAAGPPPQTPVIHRAAVGLDPALPTPETHGMPRHPTPLPDALPWPVLTRAEALRAEVTPSRLRASDLRCLRAGLYARGEDPLREEDVLAALCREDPDLVGVGPTAARLHGLPLPRRLQQWDPTRPLTIASRHGRRRSGPLLDVRRLVLADEDIRVVDGPPSDGLPPTPLRLTTPVRTWRDLGGALAPEWLVVIGDHLVRHPRPRLEGRTLPYCRPEELVAVATGRHAGRLREAAGRVRVGSDSPQETLLRLCFEAAGLPDPLLNCPIVGSDGRPGHVPDFQWRRYRVCAEYDGRTHSDPLQVSRDVARSLAAERAGYWELRLVAEDAADGGRRAVARIRSALRERGWEG